MSTQTIEPAPTAVRPAPDLVEVVRILVLLQAGIALLGTAEIVMWGMFLGSMGPLMPSAVLTGAATVVSFAVVGGLSRRSKLARRVALIIESAVLLVFAVDLRLALFMAHRPLELVPTLTRLVIPVAVIVLLRKRAVRSSFGPNETSSTHTEAKP